jgi:hypothetical protein
VVAPASAGKGSEDVPVCVSINSKFVSTRPSSGKNPKSIPRGMTDSKFNASFEETEKA